jgi:hypothetical protein
MQPATLALLVTLLPLFTINAAYLISAVTGSVPWCVPYIQGCTSISRAARLSDAIFLFRAVMIIHGVLLIFYWLYARRWLDMLAPQRARVNRIVYWLGIIAAGCLIIYVDFLGFEGAVYRFMRQFGITFYFTLTPLAQMLMLGQLYKLVASGHVLAPDKRLLNFQLLILLLILLLGYVSLILSYTGLSSFESENIVEWNFSLLLIANFSISILMWKELSIKLMLR